MATIAFVTHSGISDINEDDALTANVLRNEFGIEVEPLPWDDPDANARLDKYDLLVIRSTWNYYKKYEQFKKWLNMLVYKGKEVLNPVPLLLWNSNKSYLRELEKLGFPIAETKWLDQGTSADLEDLINRNGYSEYILKPVVSAGAWQTWRIPANEAQKYQPNLDEILSETDAMLQPFFDEIVETGEYSLTYIDNSYSHTTLKQPKDGDYRVQREHGGTYYPSRPDDEWIDLGNKLLRSLPYHPLYTRMDGIDRDGQFQILEVELLEPDLYTRFDEQAPWRFANALANHINNQQ